MWRRLYLPRNSINQSENRAITFLLRQLVILELPLNNKPAQLIISAVAMPKIPSPPPPIHSAIKVLHDADPVPHPLNHLPLIDPILEMMQPLSNDLGVDHPVDPLSLEPVAVGVGHCATAVRLAALELAFVVVPVGVEFVAWAV
jgi:hypothetical protein